MSVERNLPIVRERKQAILKGDPELSAQQKNAGKLLAQEQDRVSLVLLLHRNLGRQEVTIPHRLRLALLDPVILPDRKQIMSKGDAKQEENTQYQGKDPDPDTGVPPWPAAAIQ